MSGALSNVVSINGVGVFSDSQANANTQTTPTANLLRGFVGLTGMAVMLQGTTAPGDGNAGLFYWNNGSSYVDDGVNVIVPYAAIGQGAWLRAAFPGGAGSVTAAQIMALDFSLMPTADPGGGKLWLNGNVVSIGTVS